MLLNNNLIPALFVQEPDLQWQEQYAGMGAHRATGI